MKEALEFLKSGIFYLATTDGNMPHVRPLTLVFEYNGKLTFGTGNNKDMYKQMKSNPNIEISCANLATNTLRITGQAKFITSPESQEKALETMPMLRGLYAVNDGIFEIFQIENATAVIQTMAGEKTPVSL